MSPKNKSDRRSAGWFIATMAVAAICSILAFIPFFYAAFVVARIVPSLAESSSSVPVLSFRSSELLGTAEGRTNFLILGLTLDEMRTDTILLVSYYHREGKLAAVNIPRDLYTFDGFEQGKLGSVFAYAKARKPKERDYPPQFLADLLSKEYGVPIHYWVTLNMRGAVDIVDALGGVTIDVERPFTDYKFPTDDYSGYIVPAPQFASGSQLMDGKTALIFARSRHSLQSNEGSDFARSRRQQLLLQAVLTKARGQSLIRSFLELDKYLRIFGRNVFTNMNLNEMLTVASLLKKNDIGQNFQQMIWSTGNGFLCDASASGAYIIYYGTRDDCYSEVGSSVPSPYRNEAKLTIQSLLEISGSGAMKFNVRRKPAENPAAGSGAVAPKTNDR
jgi:LCP family protein required for cell wall assembly